MEKHSSVDPADFRWHLALHPSIIAHSPSNPLASRFLHPTRATLAHKDPTTTTTRTTDTDNDEEFLWNSREHRKNRHIQQTPKSSLFGGGGGGGSERYAGNNILIGILHMSRIEYWNVSWAVALSFTIGSVIWVVNGFYSFLPFVDDAFGMSVSGIGWTAWVGATVFEFGAVLGVLEAWNRGDTANFGLGVERIFSGGSDTERTSGEDSAQLHSKVQQNRKKKKWIWFSTDTKYWHELGFLAAFVQFLAATIFWISGFTALPAIQNTIATETGVLDGVFWTPQVVGGTGFIISSSLLLLETQKKWYRPNPFDLGWQIAIWNLIGAIGFTLCGALGYAAQASHRASYESSLATFWGGWAFLIGSVLQWYESVNSI